SAPPGAEISTAIIVAGGSAFIALPLLARSLILGSAGDSPAPVGDPPSTRLASAVRCSGSHPGGRRGRHLAARNGTSEHGSDGEAHTRQSAGQDVRLYGRRDVRRHAKRIPRRPEPHGAALLKGCSHYIEPLFPFRPASRRTKQAGRLCYPVTIFQTRTWSITSKFQAPSIRWSPFVPSPCLRPDWRGWGEGFVLSGEGPAVGIWWPQFPQEAVGLVSQRSCRSRLATRVGEFPVRVANVDHRRQTKVRLARRIACPASGYARIRQRKPMGNN